ncbi:hypothetical protein BRDID11002_76510 [Bradyrhizobium diazoefficiens]
MGYVYKQLGCDSGSGDRLGCFRSQVASVGRQVGFIFPVGDMQGYLNLKAYKEFAAENRPRRLECLGDVCHLAGSACADRATEADDYKVVPTSR